MLQEVRPTAAAAISSLGYTTTEICPFSGVGGVAVVSPWPTVPGSVVCRPGQGMLAVQVDTPDGVVWLISVHLHWPWPYRQAAQVAHIMPILQGLSGPTIVGGDFNMTPWGSSVRGIAEATGTVPRLRPPDTFPRFGPLVPLPIDHILAPTPGAAITRPEFGSDHLGLVARVGISR